MKTNSKQISMILIMVDRDMQKFAALQAHHRLNGLSDLFCRIPVFKIGQGVGDMYHPIWWAAEPVFAKVAC